MMAYERFESAQDNFGKFVHHFQPETKKLEKILIKLYKQNLLFNQTWINERLLPTYKLSHTHTHIYIYIYIYIYIELGKVVVVSLNDTKKNAMSD